MYKLVEYSNRQDKPFIIVGIVNEQEITVGFTVADKNMHRATDKNFVTAERAMKWADDNYKGLIND